MRIFLTLTLCLAAPLSASFFDNEHVLDTPEFLLQYESVLSKTVFDGYDYRSQISFRAMPSFSGEYGFWLEFRDDTWRVHHTRAQKNLWYLAGSSAWGEAGVWSEIPDRISRIHTAKLIDTYTRALDSDLAERLVADWNRVLSESPSVARPDGLDGAIAVFRGFTRERGMFSRSSWSPQDGSPARHLWKIADALAAFARGGVDDELRTLVPQTSDKRQAEAQPGATDNPDDAQRLREDH